MKNKDIVKPIKAALQNCVPYLSSILDPFLQQYHIWQGAFYSAIGLFGVYMAYNQDEVNEIVGFIKKHPEKFRQEIVNSKEFEKAFLLFFEQYMKQRINKKKEVLKNILLGYTLSNNKTDYELERLNDSLVRMTISTLQFLIFLKDTIVPALKEQCKVMLIKEKHQQSDRSDEWWMDDKLTKVSISSPIQGWLHNNFSPTLPRVKEEYGIKNNEGWIPDLEHRAETRERDKRNEINENMTELVTLGILRTKTSGGTFGGGGGTDYVLTSFGLKFLKQIDNLI